MLEDENGRKSNRGANSGAQIMYKEEVKEGEREGGLVSRSSGL